MFKIPKRFKSQVIDVPNEEFPPLFTMRMNELVVTRIYESCPQSPDDFSIDNLISSGVDIKSTKFDSTPSIDDYSQIDDSLSRIIDDVKSEIDKKTD